MSENREIKEIIRLGIEDPRIQQIGRDFYITYTAASVYPANSPNSKAPSLNTPKTPWRTRVSAMKTRDFRHFDRLGVILPEIDSKDAILLPNKHLGYFWLIHRVNPHIFISRSKNLHRWDGGIELMNSKEKWEELKIGAAGPVIDTKEGYIFFYHGVSASKTYSIGAALLSKDNPLLVLKRTKEPLFSPKLAWEKKGVVSNVVFQTGHIQRGEDIFLYYGAADRSVGLVKLKLAEIIKAFDE